MSVTVTKIDTRIEPDSQERKTRDYKFTVARGTRFPHLEMEQQWVQYD